MEVSTTYYVLTPMLAITHVMRVGDRLSPCSEKRISVAPSASSVGAVV